jgi:hypothetical protein
VHRHHQVRFQAAYHHNPLLPVHLVKLPLHAFEVAVQVQLHRGAEFFAEFRGDGGVLCEKVEQRRCAALLHACTRRECSYIYTMVVDDKKHAGGGAWKCSTYVQ